MQPEELITGHHGWQPIASAPHDGTEILAWPVEDGIGIIWFGGAEWQLWSGCSNFAVEPTHWMQLPAPPIHRCPKCQSCRITKSGVLPSGSVRLQCLDCKKQWVPDPKKPGPNVNNA